MYIKMLAIIAVLIFIWLIGTVGIVQAHEITPKTSQPAPGQALEQAPSEVVIVFTEELVLNGSSLQVFDAAGKEVDLGGGGLDLNDAEHATLQVKLNALKEGVYTVKWQVKLLDGHSNNGSYHFGVGKVQVPSEEPDDDGSGAPASNTNRKSPNTNSSISPMLWIAAGLSIFGIAGVAFVLLRRKEQR